MKRITLKQLAKELGVSTSTVSKALNDSYEISESTKQKIISHANKINYVPNNIAKKLKVGRSNTIGLIISTIKSTFQAQIVEAMHRISIENGFNLILMQSHDSVELERKAVEMLFNYGIDGLLISPVSKNSNLDFLKNVLENIPITIFDRIDHDLDTNKVGVDNESDSYKGTKELIKIGRRQIALLGGKDIGISMNRLDGYKKALIEAGIEFNPKYILNCDYSLSTNEFRNDIRAQIAKLMEEDDSKRINAIFSTTDTLSLTVLGALFELNIKVPDEIAVIGFSNTDIATSLNPALSTIRQPTVEMANRAINKLVESINKKGTFENNYDTILLNSKITLRRSTLVS